MTGIYNQSTREKQKRAVLDGIALELRRIIGEPAVKAVDQTGPLGPVEKRTGKDELRLAA